jgi:hypothetical protein
MPTSMSETIPVSMTEWIPSANMLELPLNPPAKNLAAAIPASAAMAA